MPSKVKLEGIALSLRKFVAGDFKQPPEFVSHKSRIAGQGGFVYCDWGRSRLGYVTISLSGIHCYDRLLNLSD